MSGFVRGSAGVRRLEENSFAVDYLGRKFLFCRQNAIQRISLPAKAGEVLPMLTGFGMEMQEIYALAYNCALLWQVLDGSDALDGPCDALYRFTLMQIADLARLYFEYGDGTYLEGFEECAVNESFEEDEYV